MALLPFPAALNLAMEYADRTHDPFLSITLEEDLQIMHEDCPKVTGKAAGPGYVYAGGLSFPREKYGKMVKVGRSNDPAARLAGFNTPNGFSLYCPESVLGPYLASYEYLNERAKRYLPIWPLFALYSDNSGRAESNAHKLLRRACFGKELFNWEPENTYRLVKAAVILADHHPEKKLDKEEAAEFRIKALVKDKDACLHELINDWGRVAS